MTKPKSRNSVALMAGAGRSTSVGDEFDVTVHKTEGARLGIDVDDSDDGLMLRIVAVKEGLIGQWNDSNPGQRVEPGHHIVNVNGVSDTAAKLISECQKFGELKIRLRRAFEVPSVVGDYQSVLAERSVVGDCQSVLLESIWMRVVWNLHVNDLLTRVVTLSTSHAAMLGDERCWHTFAVSMGGARLERLLKLVLVDEQEFWAWPLCQVRVLDLNLDGSEWITVDKVQKLLLGCLDLNGTLCSLRLRKVPVIPPQDPSAVHLSAAQKSLVQLVNPVLPNFPAASCKNFLLDPGDLGQLRLRLGGFSYFRLGPSMDVKGQPTQAVDLSADRGTLGCERSAGDDADLSEQAVALVEKELGALRHLPPSRSWVSQDFAGWSTRMQKIYRQLLCDGVE